MTSDGHRDSNDSEKSGLINGESGLAAVGMVAGAVMATSGLFVGGPVIGGLLVLGGFCLIIGVALLAATSKSLGRENSDRRQA